MTTKTLSTLSKKQKNTSQAVLEELKIIRGYLEKLLFLIPEESLKEYKNSKEIKENYQKALREFPQK